MSDERRIASRSRRANSTNGGGERGRLATSPTEIPSKGWLDIVYRAFKEVSNDRLTLVAAGVTFYLLLALAPTLAAFVSIYGLFFDPATIQEHAAALSGVLPGGGMDILNEQLDRLASAETQTLGFAFAISLGLALWSANAGMKALFEGVNVAYDETEERSFIKLTLITMTFTILTLASVIGLIVFNLLFSTFTELTGLDALPSWVINAITAGISLLALIIFMAALYRWAPSRATPQWKWITPGAVFAGLMIVVVSIAFSFYVANFGTYNETYGSLGAIIGFLTWLWLTMIVLLVGGEINSEMEHQTSHDTTTGAPEPMGQRGAVMADNVGPTWRGKKAENDGGSSNLKRSSQNNDTQSNRAYDPAPDHAQVRKSKPSAVGLAFLVGALGVALANRGGRSG